MGALISLFLDFLFIHGGTWLPRQRWNFIAFCIKYFLLKWKPMLWNTTRWFLILPLLCSYSSDKYLRLLRGSNSILHTYAIFYKWNLSIMRHKKVWNVKRLKEKKHRIQFHTCGIYMSLFLHRCCSNCQQTQRTGGKGKEWQQQEKRENKTMFLKSLISHFIVSLRHVLSWRKWKVGFYGTPPCRVIRSSG